MSEHITAPLSPENQSSVIPFVSGLNDKETHQWLTYLTNAFSRVANKKLRVVLLQNETVSLCQAASVAIVANPDEQQLAMLPRLIWVQSLWAGVEKLVANLSPGISIVRMEDPELARTMAEAALTWCLYLHRDMHIYARQQIQRVWLQHDVKHPSETRIGLLGLGNLGLKVGRVLSEHGFQVSAWSRKLKQVSNLETYSGQAGLEIILSQSDIIVVLLPLTSETRHLLNSDTLGNVNKRANNRGACIINFARGAIIDKQALTDKIANQQIEHAVLDVFDKEPLADSDPLWQNPNITILPHISAPTNMTTASVIAVDNILNWLDSGQLPRTVDRQKQY